MGRMLACYYIIVSLIYIVYCDTAPGLLPKCHGVNDPVHVTDSYLSKEVFFVVQIHRPELYRKRYYFHKAIEGIGNDPNVDFKNKKTMVFLDGYLDSTNFFPARSAAGNYLMNGTYNTITIDTQRLYSFIYPIASRINRQVGNITATLLNGLRKYGLKSKDIELVGISMGAQTVSFVGKNYHRLSGEKVGVINSFDPSGPCFRNEDPDHRLTTSDADFVQVIHSNNEGYGMGTAVGHVDFYVNGGEFQNFLLPYSPHCDEFCSHVVSYGFFFLAFHDPYRFVGVKCASVRQAREHRCYGNDPLVTNFLGPKVDRDIRGIFYVPVTALPPFYPPKDFIQKKIVYPFVYGDAFSEISNFVMS